MTERRPLPVPDDETLARFCRGEGDEEPWCFVCRGPVPTSRRKYSLYCCARCKRFAENVRLRPKRTAYTRKYRKKKRRPSAAFDDPGPRAAAGRSCEQGQARGRARAGFEGGE